VVTKRELAAQSQRLAAEEAEKQRQSEASRAMWLADFNAKTEARAKMLVNGELGAALTRWNMAGLRRIRLTQYRVWRTDGGEVYGDPFRLGFSPDPKYGPTKTLLASLRRAGFAAEVVAEEEQNVEWQPDGDGMGPVTVPGYHTVHYLVIDWS
jgi:hypothetical protein